ncbi:GrpE protein 1, mitochondrial [Borealophlyctis nickersoniae]|nr:GrpE protein 1, mitochondrial [Borealophlyctis nickersoniae]
MSTAQRLLSSSVRSLAARSLHTQCSRPLLNVIRTRTPALSSVSQTPTRRWYSTEKSEGAPAEEAAGEAKPAAESEAAAEPKTEDLLAEKDKQIAQLQDSYRRALAEAENVRQRSRKEVEQAAAFAMTRFAKDLLETADVLTIALKSVPEAEKASNEALKNLCEGVDMTKTALLKTFARFGVEPYEPVGEKFDPNWHEAIFQTPMEGKEPGTVMACMKTGYKIQDRVLRPAQVGVVKAPE